MIRPDGSGAGGRLRRCCAREEFAQVELQVRPRRYGQRLYRIERHDAHQDMKGLFVLLNRRLCLRG